MQVPLEIAVRDMPRSEALEARIRDLAARLERVHPRITSCRVAVDEMGRHAGQGRQFRVKVEVTAPGHAKAVSTLHHDEDVYVAARDAFESAARQLEEIVREQRGDVKVLHPREGRERGG